MDSSPIVCVDASFVLRLLLGGPGSGRAEDLWEQWGRDEVSAMAPGLIFYEITNALHRLSVSSVISVEEEDQFLGLALELSIDVISEPFLHRGALLIARKCGLKSTYDAHYLALAQELDSDLWTADRRLVNTVTERFPLIKFLGDQ
jgi:predicted nucleic acid-binding protein